MELHFFFEQNAKNGTIIKKRLSDNNNIWTNEIWLVGLHLFLILRALQRIESKIIICQLQALVQITTYCIPIRRYRDIELLHWFVVPFLVSFYRSIRFDSEVCIRVIDQRWIYNCELRREKVASGKIAWAINEAIKIWSWKSN